MRRRAGHGAATLELVARNNQHIDTDADLAHRPAHLAIVGRRRQQRHHCRADEQQQVPLADEQAPQPAGARCPTPGGRGEEDGAAGVEIMRGI